jgi:hypothetical protein
MNLTTLLIAFAFFLEVHASYGLFLIPNAKILSVPLPSPHLSKLKLTVQFTSSLIVPAYSPASNLNAIQAVWPGLQDNNGSTVLQNVVENHDGGPHEWFLQPFYCCKYVSLLSFSR